MRSPPLFRPLSGAPRKRPCAISPRRAARVRSPCFIDFHVMTRRRNGDGVGQAEKSIAQRVRRVTLTTDMTRLVWTLLLVAGLAGPADAQFRRGFGDAREVTLFPIEPPAMLLPSNATVEVVVRNASSAPARIADRVKDLLGRQLTDNDPRLRLADQGGDLVLTATLTEFTESRRNSTKYVSETRQVGTRQVTDKNGKTRTEPIYEYGRNRPSVRP